MLFLLIIAAQGALPTDWANVYFCLNKDDCLDSRDDNWGWSGPQESFNMCRDSNLMESEMFTFNHIVDRNEMDYFKGADTWNLENALKDGTVPTQKMVSGSKFYFANKCCPGNKSEQCTSDRCAENKNGKKCKNMNGCFWKGKQRGGCIALKQAGICDDYKKKKDCKNANKPKKTMQQPPTDARDGKCLWLNNQCRPWFERRCSKFDTKECGNYKGCKLSKDGQKCQGRRKPIGQYPNYGDGPCEFDEECTCLQGQCEDGGFMPPDGLDLVVSKRCMCIMIGRPYDQEFKTSKSSFGDEWC